MPTDDKIHTNPLTVGLTTLHPALSGSAAISNSAAALLEAARARQFDYAQLGIASLPKDVYPNLISNLDAISRPYLESPEVTAVKDQLNALHKELRSVKSQLDAKDKTAQNNANELESVKKTLAEIEKKSRLSYLLDRIDSRAHSILLSNTDFADQFADGKVSNAYVVSIDIRRSTELMLKASSPGAFAEFISRVSAALSTIIKSNFGVVDKFTGDGMLGFFPESYSGEDAGVRAIRASIECHKMFDELYEANWAAFDTVLLDVGLGIGIDYGPVQLMRVSEGLTVVGRPVVYACRLSGAPAGSTYVNESARSALTRSCSTAVRFERLDHEVKHEGRILVSKITVFEAPAPKEPQWLPASKVTPE